MNNIKIEGSTIGVLNTGTIQTVDAAVTVLNKSGEQDAAGALTRVTEAIVKSDQISEADKNQLLELLSLVSTEATAPKEKRRAGAMRAIFGQISSLVSGTAAVAELWHKCQPVIKSLFGF
jgi:hypothetical protein